VSDPVRAGPDLAARRNRGSARRLPWRPGRGRPGAAERGLGQLAMGPFRPATSGRPRTSSRP